MWYMGAIQGGTVNVEERKELEEGGKAVEETESAGKQVEVEHRKE
jgi:hypothetical protein